jgi:hypothetical protein
MQITRQRLFKTRAILETSLTTLNALHGFFRNKVARSKKSEYLLDELDGLINKYESHRTSITRLMDIAEGTMTLVRMIVT